MINDEIILYYLLQNHRLRKKLNEEKQKTAELERKVDYAGKWAEAKDKEAKRLKQKILTLKSKYEGLTNESKFKKSS